MSKAVPLTRENIIEQVKKNLDVLVNQIPQYNLAVGIPAGKKNPKKDSTLTVAEYAAVNEFGSYSRGIPSRPFMRTTFRGSNLIEIRKGALKALTNVAYNNGSAEQFMSQLGFICSSQVKKNIRHGDWVGNSEYTKRKKGSSRPLIDTGTMRQSVSSWVVKK